MVPNDLHTLVKSSQDPPWGIDIQSLPLQMPQIKKYSMELWKRLDRYCSWVWLPNRACT